MKSKECWLKNMHHRETSVKVYRTKNKEAQDIKMDVITKKFLSDVFSLNMVNCKEQAGPSLPQSVTTMKLIKFCFTYT